VQLWLGLLVFLTGICGYRLAAILIGFFISSSLLTKYQSKKKKKIEYDYKEGGQRNGIQVFSNGGIATIFSLIYLLYFKQYEEIFLDFKKYYWESMLLTMILGHYSCCNGDTWASEIGILSKSKPRLITNWKQVPAGTNGGITLLGLVASIAGGTFIGIIFYISSFLFCSNYYDTIPNQWPVILVGSFSGFIGSIIDSFLGAIFQYSGWCSKENKIVYTHSSTTKHISGLPILNNHMVNFISALITSLFTGYLSQFIFC
jgi:uncharacterized protein (TIGR00297 family)